MYGPPEVDDLFLRYQEPEEIFPALEFLKQRKPRSYLELGSGAGVSLHCSMEAFGPECEYCAIDILGRGEDTKRLMDIVEAYSNNGFNVGVIESRTQKTQAIQYAAKHGPWDIIMVDADHSFRAVMGDVQNYAPALAEGGALIMHDVDPLGILDILDKRSAEVADSRHAWVAMKALLPSDALHEFITPGSRFGSKKGIGVVEAWALKHV